ncbi:MULTISPECIES: hypothetical protein [Haloprofundus]|uniref:hypothetical protein n=1 Tax=Haloprofundus TaxID=1911573 RepID=UPI0013009742|nr:MULTISPECIES: hypothetical protein [Haloprofundus]
MHKKIQRLLAGIVNTAYYQSTTAFLDEDTVASVRNELEGTTVTASSGAHIVLRN